jgi:signal transduction histidine kinase
VPVVFLTAVYDQPEHRRRGYDLGAIDFIEKPFETAVLRGKVRSIVSLYMRGREIERARSREIERIKDVFLGAVGHDLRTPLNSIVMASRILGSDECSTSERRGHAMRVEVAARRMNHMIEDILDLTRGHFAGGIPVTRARTDIGEVTFAVVSELRLARPNRPVDLEVTGDLLGEWDSGRMARVISNLVDNAIQHCSGGPVRVTVTADGDVVVLAVHNGGDVIPSELLPHLFEPFRRGEASGGVGLGLFIVREIVLAHGGKVDVTSSSTDGTTFTVRVPRHASAGIGEHRNFRVARSDPPARPSAASVGVGGSTEAVLGLSMPGATIET